MAVFSILISVWAVWATIYFYFKWKFSYWKRKNVPFSKPQIPFGTPENPVSTKLHPSIALQNFYHQLKSEGHKHGGLYWFATPVYMVVHPDYLKAVLVKDFQYFSDRGKYFNKKDDPLSAHLFNIDGGDWYKLRANLTPTFTSGKIKMMFYIIDHCAKQLKNAVNERCINKQPIDTKALLECFTTDVIGSCAFGLDCNSFSSPTNEFKQNCHKCAAINMGLIKSIFIYCYPDLARFFRIRYILPSVSDFFLNTIIKTTQHREQNNMKRNDFLNLLIKLQKTSENKNGLTLTEIAAQALVFFIAGFETSSATMSYCLYELAFNQNIQDKLRNEITETLKKHNNVINYDAIIEMKYLGQVIDETLRKYPSLPIITRKCVQNYTLPDTNVTIEKGTSIIIPCFALHHDPEYFPDPDKFDPERFNTENKTDIFPHTYLPFGIGPRNCIGLRFGLLQVKVGLATLLIEFKFLLSTKTKTPFEYRRQGIFLSSANTIWLNVEKIE